MAKKQIVWFQDIISIRNIQVQVCNCKHQRCGGYFIPTKKSPNKCMFSYAEEAMEKEIKERSW